VASTGLGATFEGLVVQVSAAVVWGRHRVGGIVGSCSGCTFTNDAVRVDRFISDGEGGLIAGSTSGGSIRAVSVLSYQLEARETTGCALVGGIVGRANGTSIAEADVEVSLTPMGAGGYGGAVGHLAGSSSLSDVRIRGQVPRPGDGVPCEVGVGGAVGLLSGSSVISRVQVEADAQGGGLVGDATTGTLRDSVVLGPHRGFPLAFLLRCGGGTTVAGNAYLDSGVAPEGAVSCSPTDLGSPDPEYFNSPTNDPLTRWDFSTIWQVGAVGSFPLLRTPPPVP
jgi:hypothetical protein